MSFPLINPKPTFVDGVGVPLVNGTVEFRDPGSDLPKSTYPTAVDATNLTNANPDIITLNSRGEAPSGLFLVDGEQYKMELKNESGTSIYVVDNIESPISGLGTDGAEFIGIEDTGGHYNATNVEDALAELASTTSGEGASIIAINDAAGDYTATDVEGALAEIWTDLGSTSVNLGASMIGVQDAAGDFTGTDVEAVLAEIIQQNGVTKRKTSIESVFSDTALQADDDLTGWTLSGGAFYRIEGIIKVNQNVGDLKIAFVLDTPPTSFHMTWHAIDDTGVEVVKFEHSTPATQTFTTLTDTSHYSLRMTGYIDPAASSLGLEWAQNTSSANATSLVGGWITITELAANP